MTGHIWTSDRGWLESGSPEHLELVWQTKAWPLLEQTSFKDDPPGPGQECKVTWDGTIPPVILDAWAHHWGCTYTAEIRGERINITFTPREPERG